MEKQLRDLQTQTDAQQGTIHKLTSDHHIISAREADAIARSTAADERIRDMERLIADKNRGEHDVARDLADHKAKLMVTERRVTQADTRINTLDQERVRTYRTYRTYGA